MGRFLIDPSAGGVVWRCAIFRRTCGHWVPVLLVPTGNGDQSWSVVRHSTIILTSCRHLFQPVPEVRSPAAGCASVLLRGGRLNLVSYLEVTTLDDFGAESPTV